jgi:hypothetical protein
LHAAALRVVPTSLPHRRMITDVEPLDPEHTTTTICPRCAHELEERLEPRCPERCP